MSSTFTWITAVLLVVGPIAESGFSAPPNPVLDLCFIKAKFGFDITVPAQETGLLTEVLVSQGQTVKQGELLAQIDDTQPKMQLEVAQHQREKAEKEYNDEIRVEYAKASRDVAQKELDINKQLNQRLPGSVPAIKIDQFDLKVKEANLQVKKVTTIDKELAELEVSVKQAEVKAANKAIERRQVLARFDGIVEEIFVQPGEWVQASQPILHLINMDELVVKGRIDARIYNPADVRKKKVTLDVDLPGGTVPFEGEITYVGSVETRLGLDVHATVKNRRGKNGDWLLRDGLPCKMTIHVTP